MGDQIALIFGQFDQLILSFRLGLASRMSVDAANFLGDDGITLPKFFARLLSTIIDEDSLKDLIVLARILLKEFLRFSLKFLARNCFREEGAEEIVVGDGDAS